MRVSGSPKISPLLSRGRSGSAERLNLEKKTTNNTSLLLPSPTLKVRLLATKNLPTTKTKRNNIIQSSKNLCKNDGSVKRYFLMWF